MADLTLEEFLFSVPLYITVALPDDLALKAILYEASSAKVDGYCTICKRETTFRSTSRISVNLHNAEERAKLKEYSHPDTIKIVCARCSQEYVYYYLFNKLNVTKIGQHPSLADIANDESSSYRSVLEKTDAAELHKAIGLAAHGVGIGSFVYLRRVFERLVYSRFNQFKATEGWLDDEFRKLRMTEKIDLLKDHLPEFLVTNSKIYSILSLGLHELSDENCLAFFNPLKLSIKIILEEDKKKKEEIALKKLAADAIAKFDSSSLR